MTNNILKYRSKLKVNNIIKNPRKIIDIDNKLFISSYGDNCIFNKYNEQIENIIYSKNFKIQED